MKSLLMAIFLAALQGNNYDDIDKVIKIFEHIESRHNNEARNGIYVGTLQISPIMVREANRINGYEKYTLSDRNDSLMSANMFKDVMEYHNGEKSLTKAIRIWTGGNDREYQNRVFDMFKKNECKKCLNR